MSCTLIFGGARSGKSAYAEQLAQQSGRRSDQTAAHRQVLYLATARADDEEMQTRIAHHQQRRPVDWKTLQEPLNLGTVIRENSRSDTVLLIDCLTVWLSNCLFSSGQVFPEVGNIEAPAIYVEQRAELLAALSIASSQKAEVILVSNEVGMGIVPMGAASRWFVDEAGRLNQAVAALSDRVIWVAAGLPLYLKGQPC
ncbi:bifunctional adenosylcobinamide kinase/adenosylcobinamide-phosphate guanylyltransferase [Undibacterium sp. SXout7W]|uniref:bifunctional adenosylcobinamide kinase/adenosylcobinamide-phosphate guanylyltransferase n=1 Tax=Undibacterium sp. SXout7W TaxID=3413049 RepID=UPI003BF2ADF9